MRFFHFLLLAGFFYIIAHPSAMGQAIPGVGAKRFLKEWEKQTEPLRPDPSFSDKYDLIPMGEEWVVGVSALLTSSFHEATVASLGVGMDSRIGEIATFRVPLSALRPLLQLDGIRYVEITETASPELAGALPSTRIDSVQAGLGGLARAYRGKGVIIAVIDWGFDYTHPNFYDLDFEGLRVSRAWDQNKLSGPPPAGYSFGTEYLGQDALLQAQHDTLYTFGPTSHGTHVAGIAGGTGAGTAYIGAAPECELIFISLKRDAPSLIDAYTYIRDYAASADKPFVVNMSFGLHLGPHDGQLLPSLAMDQIQGPGRVFVASAGNNGSAPFHIDRNFTQESDTLKTVVGFGNVADQFGQTLSIWGSPGTSFQAALRLTDGNNNTIYQTEFFHTADLPALDEYILVAGDTFHLILESLDIDPVSGRPHIQMELRNKPGLKVVLLLHSEDSHVHVWNTIRLFNRYTNWGVAFTSNYPGATAGNIRYGIGEPGGCGISSITVGSYQTETYFPPGNPLVGNLSNFSSWGPTVDERVKPEITSTGQSIVSSINSFDTAETTGFAATTPFQGRDYPWKAYSGTSMSGPMVAGMVALMLEAHPALSAGEAREILKATARLDKFTGNIGPEGTNYFGWGKANALAAVLAAEAMTTSVAYPTPTEGDLLVFPNPARTDISLAFPDSRAFEGGQVMLYSLEGKRLREQIFSAGTTRLHLELDGLSAGAYLVVVRDGLAQYFRTLVVSP